MSQFKNYNIYFFNHFHNGDVFYSKEFVNDIKNKIGSEHFYAHINNSSILKDTNIQQKFFNKDLYQKIDKNVPFFHQNNNLFINTWVGTNNQKYLTNNCSLLSNYELYSETYNSLGIKIENIDFYIPTINFDIVDKSKIDSYFNDKKTKNVLICNNDTYSGQAINFDFDPIIDILSNEYDDLNFILTNNTKLNKKNVICIRDIIEFDMNNLLEISYVSTKCDIIIGRASGPFCFTHIKNNILDKNKTFLSFCFGEKNGKWVPDNLSLAKQEWSDNFNVYDILDRIRLTIKNKYLKNE